MLWCIFIILFSIYFYINVIKPHSHWKNKGITYKSPWPIFGNLASVIFRRKIFPTLMQEMYNECNGRYFGVYSFLTPMLFVKDLELIKKITIKDFDHFLDHKRFISDEVDPLFGKNLFSLCGQKWRHMRSTFSPAFTGSKMKSMYVLMAETAENYSTHLQEQSKSTTTPLEVDMNDLFIRYSNDAIASCAFGIECNSLKDRENDFYTIGKESLTFEGIKGFKFFGYTLSPMLMELFNVKFFNNKASAFYRNVVKETMEIREKEKIFRPDMINLLMQAKKGTLKYEESTKDDDVGFATAKESAYIHKSTELIQPELSDDDLTSQALVFFLAGFETVSGAMVFMAYELAINPDIQEKLQQEIDLTFENYNGKITYDRVKEMKYLDMIVSEVLRKYPVPVVDRICTKPYIIPATNPEEKDLVLEVGDCVWMPVYGIHHDPEYFPNPERFDPERFSDENKKKIGPVMYLPFGTGPRNCIGNRFALLETKTVFIYLLKNFTLSAISSTQIPLKLADSTFGLHTNNVMLGLSPRE